MEMSPPTVRTIIGGDVPLPIHQLHSQLRKDVESLTAPPRLGNVTMDVTLCVPGESPSNYLSTNICSLLVSHKYHNALIYFHPKYSTSTVYDVADVDESISSQSTEDPTNLLLASIQRASIAGNDCLVSSGRNKKQKATSLKSDPTLLYLRCQCAFTYKGGGKVDKNSGKVVGRDDYRSSTISNDKKNQRSGKRGKNGSHRTDSLKRFKKSEAQCGFHLSVYLGSNGYYVKTGLGNPHHEFHEPRMHIRLPSKLVHNKEQTIVKDLHSAKALSGVARNTYYVRSSRKGPPTLLSHSQIRYLCKKYKNKPHDASLSKTSDEEESSGMDDLFEYLEDSNSSYVTLLQRVTPASDDGDPVSDHNDRFESIVPAVEQAPSASLDEDSSLLDSAFLDDDSDKEEEGTGMDGGGCGLINSSRKCSLFNETRIGDNIVQEDYAISTSEDRNAHIIANDARKRLAIKDKQEMVVGIAYVTPFELRQFILFHCVLHIDATADSNNEGRPLVTVTSKDSNCKMFTILQAFLPNEQAWLFKWLFQVCFPSLLGSEHLNDVRIVLGDGDPQQISQLEDAIIKYFPHVYRARCSWHIIDRGWVSKVKFAMGGHSRKKRPLHLRSKKRKKAQPLTELNRIARKLYRWMFSWAQANHCETREEFNVSKALFLAFVQSSSITELIGSHLVDTIVEFLREHVSHHEDRFCYYVRRGLFHLETHSNTLHEGTNNALFNCAAPVMPTNSLERAVSTLHMNADLKTQNTCIMMEEKMASRKLWSDSPTSNHVTDLCENLLMTEWSKSDDWIAYRANAKRWLVCYRNEEDRHNDTTNDWVCGFDDEEKDGVDDNALDDGVKKLRKFGVIPKFSRVREVQVNESSCLVCSCLKQSRMGFPCRHVGAVMKSDTNLKSLYPIGYPLSSIQVFWRLEYYLYGMSTDNRHAEIKKTLMALAKNDTTGVHCPVLPSQNDYNVPDHVLQVLHSPAECRVLNYRDELSAQALRELQDRQNHVGMDGSSGVPPGLSQTSYFGEDGEGLADFITNTTEFDNNDKFHTSEVLKCAFYDTAEAINNSSSKSELEENLLQVFNEFMAKARGNCDANTFQGGHRISMLPANSKRKKTHGTKHMH